MFLSSIRSLRRAPSFTVVAILSLGLGIGSATAIFSLVNTVLLKALPYRQPDRLVAIREIVTPRSNTYPSLPVNYQHFLYWREHARSFESIAAIQSWGGVAYLAGNEPVKVDAAFVSANLFQLLGVQPQIGRSFLPGEGQKGHDQVAIITDSLWIRRFGRDPNLIGKTITLSYEPYTLVGVESLSRRYFQVRLSNGFACAALLLALIGIYGVVAYHAAQRRTEVAVRLALGATRIDIFRLLLNAGLRPVAIGVVVGLAASLLSAKFLQSLLFGVRADDPLTMIFVILLLAATALCACVLPARRAVRIQPAEALRYE